MRLLAVCLKVVIVILIIFAVISYVNYLKTGRFWVPNISFQAVSSPFKSFVPSPEMKPLESPKETIYKWREQDEWVYGDTPPAGVDAQLISEED